MGRPAKRRCGICCRLVHSKGGSSQGIPKIRLTPGQVLTYVFELPYSRAQETEADEVSNKDFFLFLFTRKSKIGRILDSVQFEIETLPLCELALISLVLAYPT